MQQEFRNIPLRAIAEAWIKSQVGVPAEGQYTHLIYSLAQRMRHICEYQPAVIAANIPHYNLSDEVVLHECTRACNAFRGTMPQDLTDVINRLLHEVDEKGGDDEVAFEADASEGLAQFMDTAELPPLPPCIRQFADIAPEGFEAAAVISTLPVLGTLGSRLRAPYITRQMLAPTFFVCLRGEQGCGKSFVTDMADDFLRQVQKVDDYGEELMREYKKKTRKIQMGNVKMSAKEAEERIPDEPTPMLRIVDPKVTQPALLKIMQNNQGLHCITVAPEIDTVRKSLASGHGNISDFLRQGFDNVRYGQHTACDTSFSGHVDVFYNTLYTGTPESVAKFFNQEAQENGLMSRFLICTLPYHPFDRREVWGEYSAAQRRIVDQALKRLNEVSVEYYTVTDKDGNEVPFYDSKDVYEMRLPWLNKYLEQWGEMLREKARKAQSVTHAKFHLRASVVGFRAGMLAWFLYGEKGGAKVKEAVCQFAVWVANMMLNGLVDNYDDYGEMERSFRFKQLFMMLPDEFDRDELMTVAKEMRVGSSMRRIVSEWVTCGVVEGNKIYGADRFKKVV